MTVATWFGGPLVTSADLVARWAREDPARHGIGCDSEWLSFGEWDRRARSLADELVDAGRSPVGLCYESSHGIDFAVAYVACHAARRPALVMNPRLPDDALQQHIDLAGAGTVMGDVDGRIKPADHPRNDTVVDQYGDPIADICFSSGTTGDPKGIVLAHRSLGYAGYLLNQTSWAARRDSHEPGKPLSHDDTMVMGLAVGSSASSIGFFDCGLGAGASLHYLSQFDGERFPEFMRQVGGTMFYGAAAHLPLLRLAASEPDPVARTFLLIGQAISTVDAAWFVAADHGSRLVNCYGLTESCAATLIATDAQIRDHVGAIGGPVQEVEIRIIDADGNDAEEGELWLRSAGMMEGYLDRPDVTARTLGGGWLHTSDVVAWEDSVLCIRGRIGDRINRGGYKFDPLDVEEVACAVRGVSAAVACAIPHPVLGEDVALVVEVSESHDIAAIVAIVRARLSTSVASYKVPRDIRGLRQLPRGSIGKPQRAHIAAWFTSTPPD